MKALFALVLSVLLYLTNLSIAYADDKNHHMQHTGKAQLGTGTRICPVLAYNPASLDYSCAYAGKTYYFCCPQCVEKFKKDPQRYIAGIKEVKLAAFQYGFSPDPVVVKKGDIVKLDITSRDVAHGVYIKEYGINVTVKKGEHKEIEFVADKAGDHEVICSLYCGPGHSRMKGRLVVER